MAETLTPEARVRLEALAEFAVLAFDGLPVVSHHNAKAFAADLRLLLADHSRLSAAKAPSQETKP